MWILSITDSSPIMSPSVSSSLDPVSSMMGWLNSQYLDRCFSSTSDFSFARLSYHDNPFCRNIVYIQCSCIRPLWQRHNSFFLKDDSSHPRTGSIYSLSFISYVLRQLRWVTLLSSYSCRIEVACFRYWLLSPRASLSAWVKSNGDESRCVLSLATHDIALHCVFILVLEECIYVSSDWLMLQGYLNSLAPVISAIVFKWLVQSQVLFIEHSYYCGYGTSHWYAILIKLRSCDHAESFVSCSLRLQHHSRAIWHLSLFQCVSFNA